VTLVWAILFGYDTESTGNKNKNVQIGLHENILHIKENNH
jgi:hypothetical protein